MGARDATLENRIQEKLLKRFYELLQECKRTLHFNMDELQCLIIIYYHLYRDANKKKGRLPKNILITENEFRKILQIPLDMNDIHLFDKICLALLKSRTKMLPVNTWLEAMSLILRGTMDEKIRYCFNAYDSQKVGSLNRENIISLLRGCFIARNEEEVEETVKDMAEVILKKLDVDRDGKISFEDYKQCVKKQPLLLEVFGQCLPSDLIKESFLATITHKPQK